MHFTAGLDISLLQSVTMCEAHLASHGKAQTGFMEALQYFLKSVPAETFAKIQEPMWKSIYNRFKKLVSDNREPVKATPTVSGIIEVRGNVNSFSVTSSLV